MKKQIEHNPIKSMKMPAPYGTEIKSKNIENSCSFFGIIDNDRILVARVLLELQENSNLYTDSKHIKHSYIELRQESDGAIVVEACGVVNENQLKSLVKRIDLINRSSHEELEELLGRCVADAFMKGRKNIEICGPEDTSKGAGMGIILIGLYTNGGISIKKEKRRDGFYYFGIEIKLVLGSK
jgi:hypothetical protein